jgi:hypothetical protein
MPRRVSLPGAAELFRATGSPLIDEPGSEPGEVGTANGAGSEAGGAGQEPEGRPGAVATDQQAAQGRVSAAPGVRATERRRRSGDRGPSGRERHEEKITVYCSPDELFELEQARLTLRGEHGLAVDRGRIVRESVAVVLADLEAKGESSILVRRLRGR